MVWLTSGLSRGAPLPLLAIFLLALSGCGAEGALPGSAEMVSSSDASLIVEPPLTAGPYDLAIHGARIIDGSGAPARDGGLLVQDGRIVYVGPLDPDTLDAAERIDAEGRVLSPGFIDAHAHGDPLQTPGFPSFLAQGVTTILLGMDGGSPQASVLDGHLGAVGDRGPWVNVAYLAGHGTLRMEAGLGYTAATAAGREALARLVEEAMDAGAFGVSLGLEYDAGRPAEGEELARLGESVAARDGIIMSHMRNEDADAVEESLEELIEQGRRSGARVHASHLKVVLGDDPRQADRMLARMEEVRREGVRITADVYPYTASFTGIGILFPDFARPPADYPAVARERAAELGAHLRERVLSRNGPEATLFGTGPWAGRTLAEAAAETGRPFEEILMELGPGGASAAYFVMDDAVMAAFLADPHVVVSSDGSPTMGHPRGYGSFPRVIRRFVIEERLLTLEEAVRKMSGQTAELLGLSDPERVETPRGLLKPGFAADLALFHPDEVMDRADFETPHRLAGGMTGVWVNGVRVWESEAGPAPGATGGPGHALRDGRGGATPHPERP